MKSSKNVNINENKENNEIKNKTLEDLMKIINENKCEFGDKTFTHTLFGDKKILFKIEDENYKEFLKAYKTALNGNYGNLRILEKPRENGPLCLDFDLRQVDSERKIKVDHIMMVVEIINKIILKYYKIQDKDYELQSFITMKNELCYIEQEELYKDGFHIEYPYLNINVVDRYLIYDESKQEIIRTGAIEELYSEIDDIEKIFDKCVISSNQWYMYGSGKKIGNYNYFYEIRYIFDCNAELIEDSYSIEDLVDILSIRKGLEDVMQLKEAIDDKYMYIKRKYMKMVGNKETIERIPNNILVSNSEFEIDDYTKDNLKKHIKKLVETDPIVDIEMAKKLVRILNPKRSESYPDWIPIGWALHNVSPKLLPDFIEFSKLSPKKYQAGCCEKVWRDASNFTATNHNQSGYTIASLYRWARQDNEKEYLKIMKDVIIIKMQTADIRSDYDMARIIREVYKYDYVCSDISRNIWYEFHNHRWRKVDQAYTLKQKLSTELAKLFALLSGHYVKQSSEKYGEEGDLLRNKSTNINKLIGDLKKHAYKDRIISECASEFYVEKFEEKLDENHYLIGFENGVYDLQKGLFRQGYPEDYLSFSTKYDYIEFSENDKTVTQVFAFLKSIQPEEDMMNYLLCFISSLLDGYNKEQKFIFWTGERGSNGKSTIVELIQHTLGSDYFGILPCTLITEKRKSSSNATPELADKKGKRFCILQEPEDGDEIKVGLFKELTGQDRITARPLYGNNFEFTPQFKLCCTCNKLPEVGGDDGGTWRRIRVTPFDQQFVDVPDPKKPWQHPLDPELRNKLPTWKQAFMWILVNLYYPKYKKDGLEKITPEKVKLSTDKYKQDSNTFLEFYNSELEKSDKDKLPISVVYDLYKEWYAENYNKKVPNQKKLKEFFSTNDFKIKNNYLLGVRMKEPEDEDDDKNNKLGLDK
jgi:P4 family phage/plasmid primase-like protien